MQFKYSVAAVLLISSLSVASASTPKYHPDWRPDSKLNQNPNWSAIHSASRSAKNTTPAYIAATINSIANQLPDRTFELGITPLPTPSTVSGGYIDNDTTVSQEDDLYPDETFEYINQLRSTGHIQLLFEALSGIPLDFVDPEIFKVVVNYDPVRFHSLLAFEKELLKEADSARKTYLLDLLNRTMQRTISPAEALNLKMAYAGRMIIEEGLPTNEKGRVNSLRRNPWHLSIVELALAGGHKSTPQEAGRIAGYLSATGDIEPVNMMIKASGAMQSNTDETAYTWKPDESGSFRAFTMDAGARYDPRGQIQWCIKNSHITRQEVGSDEVGEGLYFQYTSKRKSTTKKWTNDLVSAHNGYTSLGVIGECRADEIDCKKSEGVYYRRSYLPTVVNTYWDRQGTYMDVYAEYQIPRKEVILIQHGEDAGTIDKIVWHWDTDDWQWGKFTCNVERR